MANTYKNAAVVLTTTAATDLYTTPANTRAIVQSVNVANVDGSDRYVTVTWYDSSVGSSYTLLYNGFVPAGTSLNALDTPLVLEAGDILRVQASASNTLHATASVLQIDSTSAIVDQSVTTAKLADASVTSTKFAAGLLPVVVCTSGTRPASPLEGQAIYETNTDRQLVWSGSAWVSPSVTHRPPMCVNERTGISVGDQANAAVAFTSAASVDTDGIHSTSVNNTRFTAKTAGVYIVSANLQPTGGAFANVAFTLELKKNGVVFDATAGVPNSYINPSLNSTALVNLAVNDYVEMWYYQDNLSGGAVTVTGRMRMAWMGQP